MPNMPKITKMDRSVAEARLASVAGDKRFWCHCGQIYANLQDLATALAGMDADAYAYHVNDTKNDFGAWVKDVIGDEALAHDLEKASTAAQATRRVSDRIAFLKKRAAG